MEAGAGLAAEPPINAVAPNRALGFQRKRADGGITDQMVQMALRALVIARWCNLSQDDIQRLEDISFNVRQQLRDERGSRRGMTAKNRALLDRLDDERFADQVQLLPLILFDRARKKPDRRSAPAMVRTALAIEILLICSVRRANLVDLDSASRSGRSVMARMPSGSSSAMLWR